MAIAELKTFLNSAGFDAASLQDISPEETVLKVYSLLVPGAEAMSTWSKLRNAVDVTGYWPVIAGSPAEFKSRDLQTLLKKLHDIPEFIERGMAMSVNQWLEKGIARVNFREEQVGNETGIAMHAALDEYTNSMSPPALQKFEQTAKGLGVDPDRWLGGEYTCMHCPAILVSPTSEEDLIGYKNILTNEPYEKVVLLLAPTKTPWEVAAFLNIGCGNQLHEPHEHFAVHKFWHEKYGAEIVSSANDTVEMIVKRPPTSNDEAQQLAQQQFVYAPDIVRHGTGKTSALASQLMNGTTWYFWWD
jgi:transcriptional regulator with XRE-family HTH domain